MKKKNAVTIGSNIVGAGAIGTFLPDIINLTPPQYQGYVSAGLIILALLGGLFQKNPFND